MSIYIINTEILKNNKFKLSVYPYSFVLIQWGRVKDRYEDPKCYTFVIIHVL